MKLFFILNQGCHGDLGNCQFRFANKQKSNENRKKRRILLSIMIGLFIRHKIKNT